MLPDNDRKIIKLDSFWDRRLFSKLLREMREKTGLTREYVADYLGKDKQQIRRYEDEKEKQLPPLPELIKLCVLYQIEPNELLFFHWRDCEKNPEPGIVYRWTYISNDNITKLVWICPSCSHTNIEYNPPVIVNNSKKLKMLPSLTLVNNLQCENVKCSAVFEEAFN